MGKSKKGKHAQPTESGKPKQGFSAFGKAVAERVYGSASIPAKSPDADARPEEGESSADAEKPLVDSPVPGAAAPSASESEASAGAQPAAQSPQASRAQAEGAGAGESASPVPSQPQNGVAADAAEASEGTAAPGDVAQQASQNGSEGESAVALEGSMSASEMRLDASAPVEDDDKSAQQVEQLSLEELAKEAAKKPAKEAAEKPAEKAAEKSDDAKPSQPKHGAAPAQQPQKAPGRSISMPRHRFGAAEPVGPKDAEEDSEYLPTYQVNPNPPKGSHRRAIKIAAITVWSILGLFLAVYVAGAFVFMGRFYPHTSIAGMDVSGKTPDEVHQMLDDMMHDYTFKVEGYGLNLTLGADDMGMNLDSRAIAEGLLSQMDPWAWPIEILRTHDDTSDLATTLEKTKLADALQAAVQDVNATATPPKNALVAYDPEVKEYVIVPEEQGGTLLVDAVVDQVAAGTVNLAPKVQLTEAVLAQPSVTSTDPGLIQARDNANAILDGAIDLVMADQVALAVNADVLSQYITFDEAGNATLDVEPVVAWVQESVDAMDTVGATRTYTRADGKVITVEGGDYGWITNSEETAEKVREMLNARAGGILDIVMKWEADQMPDENGRDFGNRYIDVDISEQYARYYGDDGNIIWESDIVSGRPSDGRDSPRGTFFLKTNDGASVLRGYKPDGTPEWESPVSFWMPFKGNSVGFHDATWQPRFGGDWYLAHGSRGCINLPYEKARELHEILQLGDAVVVHD